MIVIASPTYLKGSYVLDQYLSRAKMLRLPVILSTCDTSLQGPYLRYTVSKPQGSTNQCWNSSQRREAIRKHVLTNPNIDWVLFLDSDMLILDTGFSRCLNLLLAQTNGYDCVVSRYPGRLYGDLSGFCGCCLISRRALSAIQFRCIEFPNHQVLDEGDLLELNLLRKGFKINRGYFVGLRHYSDATTYREVLPHPMPFTKRLLNSNTVRRFLLEMSLLLRCNFPAYLQRLVR